MTQKSQEFLLLWLTAGLIIATYHKAVFNLEPSSGSIGATLGSFFGFVITMVIWPWAIVVMGVKLYRRIKNKT